MKNSEAAEASLQQVKDTLTYSDYINLEKVVNALGHEMADIAHRLIVTYVSASKNSRIFKLSKYNSQDEDIMFVIGGEYFDAAKNKMN